MRQIPRELEEAAQLDGCSPFRIFWRIFFPLSAPGLATVTIFNGIGLWNEFIFAYMLLQRAGIPVVEMWDLPSDPIDTVVGFSNSAAARAMVRHLHERGYRRIGFIAGASERDRRGHDRMRGYVAEIKALGLGEPRVIRLGDSPITMSHGAPAISALLDTWPDTEAVMCVSDMVMINTATAGVDYHVPFGGRKGSSYGPREQGAYAREFYTSVKTAYINPGAV